MRDFMLKAKSLCAVGAVLAILSGSTSVAQSPTQAAEPPIALDGTCLDFRSALQLSADRDPRTLGSLARELDFNARVTEARSLMRPQISSFARSGFGDTGVVDNGVSNQVGVQISQRVFDFGNAKLSRDAARLNALASTFDTQSERMQAARATGFAILTVLEAKEKIEQTKNRVQYFEQQLESLDRMLSVGGATTTERATVASEIADTKSLMFELALTQESAEIEVELATGLPTPICTVPNMFSQSTGHDVANETKILLQNPDVQSLQKQVAGLAAETERQQRSRWPILSLVATGSYASAGGFNQFEYQDRIGIDVRVPIYTGGQLRASTQRASSREQLAKSELVHAQRRLKSDVRTAKARLLILQNQREARLESIKQRGLLVEAADKEYTAGTITYRELIEVRVDYEQVVLGEITTRYDIARLGLELMLLDGDMSDIGE